MSGLGARVSAWTLLGLVGLGACSLLVEEPAGPLRCRLEDDKDADPCPGKLRCLDGTCQQPDAGGGSDATDEETCVPRAEEETCNGIDDNCNGEIDEGHDADGDKYTWCGSGVMKEVDCDDFDANANPGAKEVCDGRDNDCDGEVDENDSDSALCQQSSQVCVEQRCVTPSCLFEGSSNECPQGTRCDASGTCVAATNCSADADCNEGEACEKKSSTCVEVNKDNGSPCANDVECESQVCMDAAALRLSGEGERVCGSPCCSDEDCSSGEFCFSSGSGARTCLPNEFDPRGDDKRPVCTASEGCGSTQTCALRDGMSVDSSAFIDRNDLETAVCGPPVGEVPRSQFCTTDDQCASGICEFPICSEPCGSSAECRALFDSAAYYCRLQSTGIFSFDYAPSCVVGRDEVGPGLQGEECTEQSDCADAGCVIADGETTGYCANLCCSDKQCVEGTRCRPLAFGERYEMRCVP